MLFSELPWWKRAVGNEDVAICLSRDRKMLLYVHTSERDDEYSVWIWDRGGSSWRGAVGPKDMCLASLACILAEFDPLPINSEARWLKFLSAWRDVLYDDQPFAEFLGG